MPLPPQKHGIHSSWQPFTASLRAIPNYLVSDNEWNNASLNAQLARNLATRNASRHPSLESADLPIARKREEILKLIAENRVIVLSGETGSGKTTQVPSFVLDEMIRIEKGSEAMIICTQPRRIAAVSVAERVAWERGEQVTTISRLLFHLCCAAFYVAHSILLCCSYFAVLYSRLANPLDMKFDWNQEKVYRLDYCIVLPVCCCNDCKTKEYSVEFLTS